MTTLPNAINPGDSGHLAHHEEVHELFDSIENTPWRATGWRQGTLAARPAAAVANKGLFYFATDVPSLSYSDGTSWLAYVLDSANTTFTGDNIFQGDSTFSGSALFESGRPWCDVRSKGAAGDGVTVDTTEIQAAYDEVEALAGTVGGIVYYSPGDYLIDAQVNAKNGVSSIGAGQEATIIRYSASVAISMLKYASRSAFTVSGIHFKATANTTATKMLHIADCVYFSVERCHFGGTSAGAGNNHTTGILIEATVTGQVPERGHATIKDILYVSEPPTAGGAPSRGIHLKGIIGQSIDYVNFLGFGNIEHANYGILFENATKCVMSGNWLIKGNTAAGIRLQDNSSNNLFIHPFVGEDSVSEAGYHIATSNCEDNWFLGPQFGTVTAESFFTDSGTRTRITEPVWASGAASIPASKWQTRHEFRKGDGGGPGISMYRNAGETEPTMFLTDGTAATAGSKDTFLLIERGSESAVPFRVDINGAQKFAVDQNGEVIIGAATKVLTGSGTPEGAVTAPVGSMFLRTDGGAATTLYIKESGAGTSGWAAK